MCIPNLKTKTHCCLTYWTSFTSHKAAPLHYHYIQIRINSMRRRRVNHLSCSPFQEVSNSSNLTNVFNVFLPSLYARQFHMNKPRDTVVYQQKTKLNKSLSTNSLTGCWYLFVITCMHAQLFNEINSKFPSPYKKSPVLIRNTNKSQEPSPQTHKVTFGFYRKCLKSIVFESH